MPAPDRRITGPQLLSMMTLFALAVLAVGVWVFLAWIAGMFA